MLSATEQGVVVELMRMSTGVAPSVSRPVSEPGHFLSGMPRAPWGDTSRITIPPASQRHREALPGHSAAAGHRQRTCSRLQKVLSAFPIFGKTHLCLRLACMRREVLSPSIAATGRFGAPRLVYRGTQNAPLGGNELIIAFS